MNSTTEGQAYFDRLVALQNKWWKRLVDFNAPYRWCMQSFNPGYTLDIGCGIGRSLSLLKGNGVGIDHNAMSVAFCRKRGFTAYTNDEFKASPENRPGRFDSIVMAHVAEHMTPEQFGALLGEYLGLVKSGGQVIILTPQERGCASDATHVHWMDFAAVEAVFKRLGIRPDRRKSFPLPRFCGRHFIYNEFVTVGRVPEKPDHGQVV